MQGTVCFLRQPLAHDRIIEYVDSKQFVHHSHRYIPPCRLLKPILEETHLIVKDDHCFEAKNVVEYFRSLKCETDRM